MALLNTGYTDDFYKAIGLDPEKIKQESQTQGLLGAGLALLAGSGPSSQPTSLGQLVAQAGASGMQAMRGAGEDQISNAIRSLQVKDMMDKRNRQAKLQEAIQNAYTTERGTGISPTGEQAKMLAGQIADFGQEGVTATRKALQSNVNAPTEQVFDRNKALEALAKYGGAEGLATYLTATKPADAPDAVRTLQYLMTNPDMMAADIARRRAAAQNINLPTKTAAELMSEVYSPQVKSAFEMANQARGFATQAGVVADLLKGKGGGEFVKKGSELARMFGIENDTTTVNDLAQSLATRGATTMRAPGSGSTSDIEFNAYRQAFPSLSNTDAGRQIMAKYADKFAKRAEQIADYKAKLLTEGKYSMTAVSEYDKSLGPILDEDFKQFVASFQKGQQPTSGGGAYDFRTKR